MTKTGYTYFSKKNYIKIYQFMYLKNLQNKNILI